MNQFDRLDAVAEAVARGQTAAAKDLNPTERLYVALAANSGTLLAVEGQTITEALAWLGSEWTAQLLERWQHRANPRQASGPLLAPEWFTSVRAAVRYAEEFQPDRERHGAAFQLGVATLLEARYGRYGGRAATQVRSPFQQGTDESDAFWSGVQRGLAIYDEA